MEIEVRRHLLAAGRAALADTPILVLQGARQVGKSTLARQIAGESAIYTNLDEQQWLDFARLDPEGFVRQAPDRLLVVDEAQRAPGLVLALKAAVDAHRRPGRYLLTGSSDLFGQPGVGDSLAGRQETLLVSPFSVGEVERRSTPEDFITWLLHGADGEVAPDPGTIERVVRGGYPEPLKRSAPRAARWFASYVGALTSHDAAEISDGPFASHVDALLRWLAAQGQTELVKAKLARQLGISQTTADAYLRLAARLYLTQEFPSWGIGFAGRETRRPKASLIDTGLTAHLTGFTAEKASSIGGREYFGLLLEQFVATELAKQAAWSESQFRIFHFRRRDQEVDLVIELADGGLVLVEVKSALSVGADSWRGLEAMRDELGDRVRAGVVFYSGRDHLRMRGWLHVLPTSALWRHP